MPRYCDVNNDKRITLTEWLNCLQVQTNVQKSKVSETSEYRIEIAFLWESSWH